ncbi:MAG: phenylalanine--tRNA ligase subunit beta [Acidobacteria bacterium]|nr:phenylalanine--tRNA ligase subunit beta [Acidobacteriota bacterium]
MKFSYNWIHELVDGLDVPAEEMGRLITLKTAECEGVEAHGAMLSEVCVARVLTAEKIEGTHLTLTTVETGRYGLKQVICGAPNCRAGMLTAYWPLGRKTVRGVESDGMLSSAAELGISRDGDGILELTGVEPGAPVAGLKPDAIVEIDNKSLTHRPDLWGHFGMAREVAAITGRALQDPVDMGLIPDAPGVMKVDVRDFALCPRYSCLAFENVTIGPSPLWLQYRLESIGLNPINNIVDVTNWVMAELAQPMHAFDLDKIQGDTIIVRTAGEGESFAALNDNTYALDSSNLVIADASGAIALAGVIGGGPSAITSETTRLLLESANFHAASVRRTSSKVKLRTDASMRFEKSQDPENTARGLARAVALLRMVSPGIRLVGGLSDAWRKAPAPPPIMFTHGWMQRKLGRPVSEDEVAGILERLAFGVARENGRFTVTVPGWRATKDISIKDDLVEEVGRMIGYASIPPQAPSVPSRVPPLEPERAFQRRVRAALTAQGFTEVYNYSFVNEAQAAQFQLPVAEHIRVLNPIAAGQELLRTSLLPNILKNIELNRHNFEHFRLFEIGREIHKRAGALPEEIPCCAVVLYSKEGDGQIGLFELKRVAGVLMPGCEAKPTEPRPFEHPHRAGTIWWQGAEMGRLFEFHPSMVEAGRAQVLYVNLTAMLAAEPGVQKYTPLRRFPTSDFDITVTVAPRALAGDVLVKAKGLGVPNLVDAAYLYEYADAAKGTKSLTFRFTLGAADRTLTSEEITAAQEQLRRALQG